MWGRWLVAGLLVLGCGSVGNGAGGSGGSASGGSATGGSAGTASGGSATGGSAGRCAGWCAYTDGLCGAGLSCFCQSSVPASCPSTPSGQVCGCDGQVYATQCDAMRAGTDITLGEWTCEIPRDSVACGAKRCAQTQACNINYTDRPQPSSYACLDVPTGCTSCDCVPTAAGCTCQADAQGKLIVTCRY